MSDLASRLLEVRGGATQARMAEMLGISTRTWQNYETGVHVPDANALLALAKAGFNVQYILTGEGELLTPTGPIPRSQPARLDAAILRAAIEAVEEGLELSGRTASAEVRADLVARVYDLFLSEEAGAGKATAAILRLIRTGT